MSKPQGFSKRAQITMTRVCATIENLKPVNCTKRDFVHLVRPRITQMMENQAFSQHRYLYAQLVRLELMHDYHFWWLHELIPEPRPRSK